MTDTSFEDLCEIACKELADSRAQRDQLLTAAKLIVPIGMPDRVANDRSVKSIKFLEAYARLCAKFDRELRASNTGEVYVTRFEPPADSLGAEKVRLLSIPERSE